MPIADPTRDYDGFANLAGGVDDGRLPNLIDKNQCVEAGNVVFRGGAPTNRPPVLDMELVFTNPNVEYNADGSFKTEDGAIGSSRIAFQTGVFQEANYFDQGGAPGGGRGKEYIMVSIGGRLWRIIPGVGQKAEVFEVQLERRNNSKRQIAYHLQAGNLYIVQDGEGSPIIFDGVSARRAGTGEIFTGKMMAYGQGRIVLIGNSGEIFFGDIRDGKGNGDLDLLGFTETFFVNEGFPTALPSGMGHPTAVQFIPQQDSATGVGECLVFGENGVESFFLSIPRDQWKDSAFQHTALLGIGNGGHRTVVQVNEDIWFRSPRDGWRSYRQARAQVNQWAQLPLSTNVSKWTDTETSSLLHHSSAIWFNNRLLTTATPLYNEGRPYNNGMLSLDFNILSTFGTVANPAWDGHWLAKAYNPLAGLRVTRLIGGIFNGEHRAFLFFIGVDGQNRMREIMPEPVGDDTGGHITSHLITRAMDWESPFNEKVLYGGDLWIDDVFEPEDDPAVFNLSYKPDQYTEFAPWYDFSVSGKGTPGAITPGMVPTMKDGFYPRKRLPKPPDTGDPLNTKRILRRGYEIQGKIRWTGRARIRRFRAQAKILPEGAKQTEATQTT